MHVLKCRTQRRIEELEGELASTQERASKLAERVRTAEVREAQLKAEHEAALARAEERRLVDEEAAKTALADAAMAQEQSRLDSEAGLRSRLNEAMAAVETEIEAAKQAANAHAEEQAGQATCIASLRTELAQAQSKITELVAQLEAGQGALSAKESARSEAVSAASEREREIRAEHDRHIASMRAEQEVRPSNRVAAAAAAHINPCWAVRSVSI